MNGYKRLIVVCALVCACPVLVGAEAPEAPPAYPPVHIANSLAIEMKSSVNDTLYSIYVLLPDGYEERPEKSYPVLYTVDAQWDFSLLAGMLGGMAGARLIPPMILVGITVPEIDPQYSFRQRDYVAAEGAAQFLEFFKRDLIPFVEDNFRADAGDRLLVGTSYGGFFVFYALFHQPDLFQRYLAGAASLWWDDEIAFRYEERFAQAHKNLAAKLFMAVGEFENPGTMVEPHHRMVNILSQRQYEGFKLGHMVIAEELHNSIKPEAYSRGLRALYAKPSIKLAAAELEKYVGRYRTEYEDGEFILTITRRGAQLYGQSPYEDFASELYAQTGHQFWSFKLPVDLTFHVDADGQVRTMTMHHAEGDKHMEKLVD